MGFKMKSYVQWIETDNSNTENKNYFEELTSIDSIDFKLFNDIDKAITSLISITLLEDPLIIINSNLFSEYIKKLIENKSNIKYTPKIIVFTKDKQDFIENNEEYINNNEKSYIILGIATTFEEIKKMLDKGYKPQKIDFKPKNKFEPKIEPKLEIKLAQNIKPISEIKFIPNDEITPNDIQFTFEYIDNKNKLLLPLYFKGIIDTTSLDEGKNFINYLDNKYSKNNHKIKEVINFLKSKNIIQIDILSKKYVELYTIESDFYKDLNKDLRLSKCKKYLPYIKTLYEGIKIKALPLSSDNMLYRGTLITSIEIEKLKKNFEKTIEGLPNTIVFSKCLLSFSKEKKVAEKFFSIKSYNNDLVRILFVLEKDDDIGYDLSTNCDIEKISAYENEKEVLFLSFSAFEVKEIKEIKIENEIAYEIKLLYLGKYLKDIEKNKNDFYNDNKLPDSEFKKELSQFGLVQKNKLENITCKNIFDSFDRYKEELNSVNKNETKKSNNSKFKNIDIIKGESIFINSKENFEEKKRIYQKTEPHIQNKEQNNISFENLNLNFNIRDNCFISICWIMSYFSWLLLVITGWASLKWLEEEPFVSDYFHRGWTIWTIWALRSIDDFDPLEGNYYPFQMHVSFYYICFIFTLIIITSGCITFFIKTFCKKDDRIINGMMGKFSKYHFIPLLCASALFIIGECINEDLNKEDNYKHKYIAGLVFAIIGLLSFIFIYIMTELYVNDWWILIFLKKGTYSCLIILMWYYFCYDIYYVHSLVEPLEEEDKNHEWKKGCGLAFSIIFGICSLIFSFVFKDLVVCFMNLLIYIGLAIAYFKLPYYIRKQKKFNKNGDGVVDIIMIVISTTMIFILLIRYRNACFIG